MALILLLLIPLVSFLTGYVIGVTLTNRNNSLQYRQTRHEKMTAEQRKKAWYAK